MSEVIVLHNQADYVDQSKSNLPARAVGWAKGERVLVFQEENADGSKGDAFQMASTVGQGMGRRVSQNAHGFSQFTAVRVSGTGASATWTRALAVVGQLATHLVTHVLDANTFEVATNGAWIGLGDTGDFYLSDVTAGGITKVAPSVKQRVGVGDGTSLHITLAGDGAGSSVSSEVGGDLNGTLPNPVVKQLTGVGAGLVAISTDFQWPASTEDAPNGGRGIGFGRTFKNGVELRAWCAQAESGLLRWTTDNWKTTVADTSLQSSGGSRWNCLRFAWLPSRQSFAWIAGDGAHKAIYYALHLAANYNADGSLRASAWQVQTYGQGPRNAGDMDVNGGTICIVGNDTKIARTTDFTTFTKVCDTDATTGGIATDNYGTWMAIERDTGVLWKSINDGATFSKVTSLTVDGKSATHLPHANGEQWGSIACAYGLWVASVWNVAAGFKAYAYSENGVDWFTFSDAHAVGFYSQAFDGVRWYATNPAANASPAVFQLLVDSIPVHRRLALEKGMAVEGPVLLGDLQGAAALGTDVNGKLIAVNLVTDNGLAIETAARQAGDAALQAQINSIGGGTVVGSQKFLSTMYPASATDLVTLVGGNANNWTVHGSIVRPEANFQVRQNATLMAIVLPQIAYGYVAKLAIYKLRADMDTLDLVAWTANTTAIVGAETLEATIVSPDVTLDAGEAYYVCFMSEGNGFGCAGVNGQTMNLRPYFGFSKANIGQLNSTTPPAVLSGLHEEAGHPYIRAIS